MKNLQFLYAYAVQLGHEEDMAVEVTLIVAKGLNLYKLPFRYKTKSEWLFDHFQRRLDKSYPCAVKEDVIFDGFFWTEQHLHYGRAQGNAVAFPISVFEGITCSFSEKDLLPISDIEKCEALTVEPIGDFHGLVDFYQGLRLEYDARHNRYESFVTVFHTVGDKRIEVHRSAYEKQCC